jgi:anti-anti-sigma factor
MEISVREKRGATIVDVDGDLVSEESRELHRHIKELVAQGRTRIALNLKYVDYIDNLGLGALAAAYVSIQRVDGIMRIIKPSRSVETAMKAVFLDRLIDTYSWETSALMGFE